MSYKESRYYSGIIIYKAPEAILMVTIFLKIKTVWNKLVGLKAVLNGVEELGLCSQMM